MPATSAGMTVVGRCLMAVRRMVSHAYVPAIHVLCEAFKQILPVRILLVN